MTFLLKKKSPSNIHLAQNENLSFSFLGEPHRLLPGMRPAWFPALPKRWDTVIVPCCASAQRHNFRKPGINFQNTASAESSGYEIHPHTKKQESKVLPARLLMTSMNPSPATSSRICSGPPGWALAIAARQVPLLPHPPNFGRQVGPRGPTDALQGR